MITGLEDVSKFPNLTLELLKKGDVMNKLIYSSIISGFIILFISGVNRDLSAQVPAQDSLALIALFDSTDGANWNTNTNWLTGQPVSMWHGI